MKQIMLFGDSITAGQYVAPRYRWTSLFARELHVTVPGEFDVDVRAVSGETSREALLRFPESIVENRVDLLLIELGLNDANFWITEGGQHPRVSLGAFRENIAEAVVRARGANVGQVILATNTSTTKIVGMGRSLQESKSLYDQAIRDLAVEMTCFCFDVAKDFEAIPESALPRYLLPDGIHLSIEGHKFYAERFIAFFFEHIGSWRDV